MPDVEASLDFLARLKLYESEKPYVFLPLESLGLDPDETRLDNLEFESHEHIPIRDMRDVPDLSVDINGFEYYRHETHFRKFDAPADIDAYRSETDGLLQKRFSAMYVLTSEVRLRRNEAFGRREFDDIEDKLMVKGPAKGAHVGTLFPPCHDPD